MAVLARERAKRSISPVAGPYGHPFHPILVTIPIGAWVASLVFDIATKVNSTGSHSLVDASYWLIRLGVIGALAAALFGLMDLLAIPRGGRAFQVGITHMTLNLVIVGLFIVGFFWRHSSTSGSHAAVKVGTGQLILSAAAIVLLLASGWLGGMLAYRFGVRVADENTQAEGFAASRP
jgi:uncharacterized membrane protein